MRCVSDSSSDNCPIPPAFTNAIPAHCSAYGSVTASDTAHVVAYGFLALCGICQHFSVMLQWVTDMAYFGAHHSPTLFWVNQHFPVNRSCDRVYVCAQERLAGLAI